MTNEKSLAVFEDYKIRRHYDEEKEIWYFSVIDIVAVLIQQSDYQTARKYWNKLKERLKKEGSESVTKCHQLKFEAADGKKYMTDAADPETLLCLIQFVPILLNFLVYGESGVTPVLNPSNSTGLKKQVW
jgi:hypothetical protein